MLTRRRNSLFGNRRYDYPVLGGYDGGYLPPRVGQAAGGVVGAGAAGALTGGGFLPGALGSVGGQYLGPLLFPHHPRRASRWGNIVGASGATLLAGGGLLPAAVVGLGAYGGRALVNEFDGGRRRRRGSGRFFSYECNSCGHQQAVEATTR